MDSKGQVYFGADDKEVPEEDAARLEEALHEEVERYARARADRLNDFERGRSGRASRAFAKAALEAQDAQADRPRVQEA